MCVVKGTPQIFIVSMEQIISFSHQTLEQAGRVHRKSREMFQQEILVQNLLHQEETIAGDVKVGTEKMGAQMTHLTFHLSSIFQNFPEKYLKERADV